MSPATPRAATLAAALVSTLCGPPALAVNKAAVTPSKASMKVHKAAKPGPLDVRGVGLDVVGEVRSSVSLCAVLHAVRGTPCASSTVLQKLVPELLPIAISHVGLRKESAAEIGKLAQDGQTEPPPPELQTLPHDLDVSVRIPSLEVAPAAGFDTVNVSGKLEAEVFSPTNKALKATHATAHFTGTLAALYAPDASGCKAAEGGDSVRVFVHLTVVSLTIDKLSTERTWWAKLLPGDKLAKWVINHVLSFAGSYIARKDSKGVAAWESHGAAGVPKVPVGIALCLGKPGGCGISAPRPPPGFATATIALGKLGTIEFAKAGANKPYLSLSSSRFLCNAFEALKAVKACVKPVFDSVFAAVLPLTLDVPTAVVTRAAGAAGASTPLSLVVQGVSIDVSEPKPPLLEVTAKLDAALADPANATSPQFPLAATGQVMLGAVCDDTSFFLWQKLALTSLAGGTSAPPWLASGLARAAVNAHLPTIDVCLEPVEVAALHKSVDVCAVGQRLLELKASGGAATAAIATLLPLTVQPAKFLDPDSHPLLAKAFEGVTVQLNQATLASGSGGDSISAQVSMTKAGEAGTLEGAATIDVGLHASCVAPHEQLSFAPQLTALSAATLPPWLFQSTVLKLVNDKLRDRPPLICVQGACKSSATISVAMPLPPRTLLPSTGCGPALARSAP